MDTRVNNRALTDAQRAERNAALLADAPTMTVRELEKKYSIGFTGVGYILGAAGVKAKNGRLSRKGEKKNWKIRKVRDKNASHLTCSRCSETKPVTEFYRTRMECRKCANDRIEIWSANNHDAVLKAKRKYAEINRDDLNAKNRAYDAANREAMRIKGREYYRKNRLKCMKKSADWQRIARKISPQFRLRVTLRQRIWRLLKSVGKRKNEKTEELIGMKYADFLKHIESRWLPGMSWKNYGWRGWHIDHIKACAHFDLTDPVQQRLCFHWTNMRPLWAEDNWKKGKKIVVDSFFL